MADEAVPVLTVGDLQIIMRLPIAMIEAGAPHFTQAIDSVNKYASAYRAHADTMTVADLERPDVKFILAYINLIQPFYMNLAAVTDLAKAAHKFIEVTHPSTIASWLKTVRDDALKDQTDPD